MGDDSQGLKKHLQGKLEHERKRIDLTAEKGGGKPYFFLAPGFWHEREKRLQYMKTQ